MLYLIEAHGPITTNTYLYGDDATQHAFLIDPGFEPERSWSSPSFSSQPPFHFL